MLGASAAKAHVITNNEPPRHADRADRLATELAETEQLLAGAFANEPETEAADDAADRSAFFCAALCIAAPDGTVLVEVEGRCDGSITQSPRGDQPFPAVDFCPIGPYTANHDRISRNGEKADRVIHYFLDHSEAALRPGRAD